MASTSYRVCLGMEEREAGAAKKAETLVQFYRAQRVFHDICYSMHPGTIVGESAGKSSNVNWAVRWMAKRVPVAQHARCVVTVMDSDTCFAADYFLAMSVKYALLPLAKRRFTMFTPPIIFDRNGPDVPVFTRLADIFWASAGIGGIYPGSAVKIPTSAYSVSMELAKFCNFWDAGPEAIGEDMHFFVKALFETKGHINSIPIYSPASQCHVVGAPAHGAVANYISDMKARWSQAVRHMWGSLDAGYTWHRILTGAFGPSVRHPTYVAIDAEDDSHNGDGPAAGTSGRAAAARAEREQLMQEAEIEDAQAVKSLFEAKLKAAEEAGLVRAVSPAGESVITESSVSSVDMFGMTRAKKFTSIDSPFTPRPIGPSIISPLPKAGVVRPPSDHDVDDDNDSDFGAEEDRALFASEGKESNDYLSSSSSVVVGDSALYSQIDDRGIRIFPFIVLVTRIYEAHMMIVHFFLMMGILSFYPSVIFQDGSIQYGIPGNRTFSLSACLQSLVYSPYAAKAGEALEWAAAGDKTPIWIMPDAILCAKQLAGIIGGIGVVFGAGMVIFHDLYHNVCAVERWKQSENIRQIVLRERHRQGAVTSADTPADMPPRYLGIRPSQTCERKWPVALLDLVAIPAAIGYSFAPLLWAQLNHLATNKLMYTVSAKGKAIVVSTRLQEGESVEHAGTRWSVEHHRIAASNQELALAVPHRDMGDGLPKPVTAK